MDFSQLFIIFKLIISSQAYPDTYNNRLFLTGKGYFQLRQTFTTDQYWKKNDVTGRVIMISSFSVTFFIKMKLKDFAFIFMVIQSVSEIASSHGENEEKSTNISKNINICSSIDECEFKCCQLNKLYVFARSHCGASIDEQLLRVNWSAPFSEDHRLSCESACSENIDQKQKITEFFQSTDPSGRYHLCNDFVNISYDYLLSRNHFENLKAKDIFRRFWLPVIVVGLSVSLLAFTLIIYLLVPELCSRIQDKCFIFHLIFRIIQLITCLVILNSKDLQKDFLCKFYAFIHQFSGLAAAFWLNVICIHLWRCLNSVIPPSGTIFHYLFYANGCALLIATVTHIADSWLPDHYLFKPHIGEEFCGIKGYDKHIGSQLWLQPQFIYYFSIKVVLQIIDLSAFLHIAYLIFSKERVFKERGNETFRRHQAKQLGLLLYLKLFLSMGLTTIMDIAIFHFGRSPIGKLFPTFITSFLLFVIFLFNKRVFQMGKKRFAQLTSSRVRTESTNLYY